MIYEYIKNKKGNLVGVVVSIAKYKIGWSLCNKLDPFDKTRAIEMASGRAKKGRFWSRKKLLELNGRDEPIPVIIRTVPDSVEKYFIKMEERAQRYYK